MRIDLITIFPEICDFYFKHSLLKKAQDKKKIIFKAHNLRDFSFDKHSTVDDKPFGGGRGMVLKLKPMYKAISSLNKSKKIKTILFSPRGKKFNQGMAFKYSKLKRIILVCGRYEGIDERVAKYLIDEQLSIGDYVMMGGEVAAMAVMESVARLVPGVLGHSELLGERIEKTKKGFTEFPQYTRPEIFNPRLRQSFGGQAKKSVKWRVPGLLLKGNHKKIEDWRRRHLKTIN